MERLFEKLSPSYLETFGKRAHELLVIELQNEFAVMHVFYFSKPAFDNSLETRYHQNLENLISMNLFYCFPFYLL